MDHTILTRFDRDQGKQSSIIYSINQHHGLEEISMSNELDPIPDQWYTHLDKGQQFYVTAFDEPNDTVEIQHFDGDIEEFSLEEWRELDIELSAAPENWAGALDIAEQDDLGTEITDTSPDDWREPENEFQSTEQDRISRDARAMNDDYGEGYIEERPLE